MDKGLRPGRGPVSFALPQCRMLTDGYDGRQAAMNEMSGAVEAAALAPRPAALRVMAGQAGVVMEGRVLLALSAASEVDAPALIRCAADAGLEAKALALRWADALRLARSGAPAMVLLKGNGAALIAGASADGSALLMRDPLEPGREPIAVDRARLEGLWLGAGVVLAPRHAAAPQLPFGVRWLMEAVRHDAALFRNMAYAALVLSVLTILPPLMLMQLTDRVLLYQSWSTLTILALMAAGIIVFECFLGWAQRHLTAVASRRLDGRINLLVMQRLLGLPLDYFERTPTGETQSRLFQTYRVRDFLTGPLFRALLDTLTLVAILPVMFLISVPLSFFVLGLGLVLLLVVLAHTRPLQRATAEVVVADRAKAVTLIETLQGIRTVKALAIEGQQGSQWNRNLADSMRTHSRLLGVSNQLQTLCTPFERGMYFGTMILGTWMLLSGNGSLSIGALFAFIILSQRVASPLVSVSQVLHQFSDVKMALAEASAVLNHPPERPAGQSGVRPSLRGAIAFEDVTFSYPGALNPALSDVSFAVPAGSVIGLVGRSGSGKSTITRLLQGLNGGYSGLVKLDGIEMREMDLAHLRRNLGVVLQDNFLFRGTIRDNVAAGRPDITFERVIAACRLAGAEEFIERLPRGYETMIEEGSPNLSGGQKQRLAIARAVVTDPPILILDEATSALDPESEAVVNANLRRLARGRTVVVVSHRLSSLVDADTILVLDRGELTAQGTHAELVAASPIYRQLWTQQNRVAQELSR